MRELNGSATDYQSINHDDMKQILLVCLFYALSPSLAEAFEPTTHVYKEVNGRKLELHVFTPEQREELAAAIVWYHGGGWREGKAGQFFEHGKILARRGMVSISVDYRGYAGTDPNSRDISPCIRDAKSAFRWVKAHANELGIDPKRIAAGGGSAGGHLAAALGTLPGYNEKSDNLSIDTTPSLTVLFNPAVSPVKVVSNDDVAPLNYINESTPEALIFHGTHDTSVPISTAYEYQRLLQKHGTACSVISYDEQPHAFFNYSGGKNPYYYLTVGELLLYLEEKGYLKD